MKTKTHNKKPATRYGSKNKSLPKRSFIRLLKGRQQKGKVAIIIPVMLFAAVGAYLLISSHAATNVQPTGTYTSWNWPGQNFTSFDWQVTPGVDQSGPDSYFFSHQFGMVNGDGGYAGMQGDQNGKRAIFSIWQALAARGPEIAKPFGGEGEGYQTVINYNWTAGRTYSFRVQKGNADNDGTWWSATIKDNVTGVVSPIGDIKIPPAWGGLNYWSVVWIERYGYKLTSCDDIHHAMTSFTNFSANNGTVFPSSRNNHLSQPEACPGSRITDIANGVRHEMGYNNPLPPIISGGTGISLSDLEWSYVSNGWGPVEKNKSNNDSAAGDGRTLTIQGQRYAQGLGVHANSEIRYRLDGKYSNFTSAIGLDDESGNIGSVSFQVWADGAKLYDSGYMGPATPLKSINVSIAGKNELKLIVTDGGDNINWDHGDWANARLVQAASNNPQPDTAPAPQPVADSQAPTITITSPAKGSKVGYWVPVSANANDNVKVTKMEVYIDGIKKAATTDSYISYTWVSYYEPSGNHTVTVKAYDAAGNVGQSSVTVTK